MVDPLRGKRLLLTVEDATLSGLLADAARRLGAEVETTGHGRGALLALTGASPPHCAILDLPLADVRGGDVIDAFRGAGVPVIAVSGTFRGPRAAEEVRRLGAADFFEKPFPVLALISSAARLLGVVLPGLEEPDDEVTAARPLAPVPADAIAASSFLAMALDPAGEPSAVASPVPQLAAPLPPPPPGPPVAATPQAGAPSRSGDLRQTSVPRILVALHQSLATGALTLVRGPVKKLLLVEKGVPAYAVSNVAGERFGAICVRRGLVSAEQLEAVRQAEPKGKTAELLLQRGLLSPAQRLDLVRAQVRAIAWSTFEWDEGQYDFQLARLPAGLLPLGLSMASLVLEGMVKASTLPRLVTDLPAETHLAPSQDPAFELYAMGLRPAEAHLLSLCDGTKNVRDLVALSNMPEREALAFLQALRVMRVLDDVARVLAGTRRIGFM